MTATPAYIEIRGSGPPELFPLDGSRVTIGRSEDNDVVLGDDKLVSQIHAVIECYGSSYALRDLGSSNGTFVNGHSLVGEKSCGPATRSVSGVPKSCSRRRRRLLVSARTRAPNRPSSRHGNGMS